MLRGARVLDLYAGSGRPRARGAPAAGPPRSCSWSRRARPRLPSAATSRRWRTCCPGSASARSRSSGSWPRRTAAADRFDLVLLDPPYDVAEDALAARAAGARPGHVAGARGARRGRAVGALARAAVARRALAHGGAPLRRDGDVVRRRRRAGRGGLTRRAVPRRVPGRDAGPEVRGAGAAGDAVRHDRPLHPAPDRRRRRRPHPRRPPPLRGPAARAARRHAPTARPPAAPWPPS